MPKSHPLDEPKRRVSSFRCQSCGISLAATHLHIVVLVVLAAVVLLTGGHHAIRRSSHFSSPRCVGSRTGCLLFVSRTVGKVREALHGRVLHLWMEDSSRTDP